METIDDLIDIVERQVLGLEAWLCDIVNAYYDGEKINKPKYILLKKKYKKLDKRRMELIEYCNSVNRRSRRHPIPSVEYVKLRMKGRSLE